ncbi:GGDEF domain-containing protein [Aestuariivirga litoralis]|uniref:GGDEF domain-containing protein n=1 Tax=Aestuariivirga litoralis TaxID=2650924 RepID=UPI0018C7B5FC|nr:GGDEF domain-containing protein [Aestuariivirga litoralis]MBG1231007.1 GGDEF domain-containing protein [Aestuariivirga litoralis]
MPFRISSWSQVFAYCASITTLAVLASLGFVIVVWGDLPANQIWPTVQIAGFVPLLIAAPTSLFSLAIIKTLQDTVHRVDEMIKYDAMTGHFARAHFLDMAEKDRADGGFLVLADADRFKSINDTYGHGVGDIALKYLSSMMLQVFGQYGYAGRLGGEEFAVRLPRMPQAQLRLLLAVLMSRLHVEGFEAEGHHLKPTLSFGIVEANAATPVVRLLRAADEALYEAKDRGRDQYVFAGKLDVEEGVAA